MNLLRTKSLFRAFADETRLRMVYLLAQGELCVCDVMRVLKQPQSKVSRHFAYLRRAGLVTGRKEGLWMYYRLAKPAAGIQASLVESLRLAGHVSSELKRDLMELRRQKNNLVGCCK